MEEKSIKQRQQEAGYLADVIGDTFSICKFCQAQFRYFIDHEVDYCSEECHLNDNQDGIE